MDRCERQVAPCSRTARCIAIVSLVLLCAGAATGCSDPDRVTPPDNTGTHDDGSAQLDAPGGLDAVETGGGQVNGCASDQDCLTIVGTIPTCEVAVCNKSVCELVNAADASACDDGDPCTQATTCLGGSCLKGTATDCDDDNPCTVESCDKATGRCAFAEAANGTACGNAGSACLSGTCQRSDKSRVLIPPGQFYMGCNTSKNEVCDGDEKPQHAVTVSRYWLDRTEVSAGSWRPTSLK